MIHWMMEVFNLNLITLHLLLVLRTEILHSPQMNSARKGLIHILLACAGSHSMPSSGRLFHSPLAQHQHDGSIPYVTFKGWLNFGNSPLNSCHFLASDWSSSFHTFPEKPLNQSTSNLIGVSRTEFPPFTGLWLVKLWLLISGQTTHEMDILGLVGSMNLFHPYFSGLLHGHWGNHMIAPVPV